MNIVILKGRLTHDVELKTTSSQKEWTAFSVAVPRTYQKDKVDFFDCAAFGKTAVFLSKYFSKGQEVLLEGELQTDSYEKSGETKKKIKIIVLNVDFCGKKDNNNFSQNDTEKKQADVVFEDIDEDEDLPF